MGRFLPYFLDLLQPHGLFALAAAGQQHHGAAGAGAPLAAPLQQLCVGHHVELEVAQHTTHRRAHGREPRGVFLRLGPDGRQAAIRRPRQGRQALRLAQRCFVESRIRQHQRNAPLPAARHQVGPHLGFHQDADGRAELAQEAPHRTRRVPGLPHLHVTGQQQLFALGPPRRGAVGEQQAHARQLLSQLGQQDGGGPGFAQRHRMHPHKPAQRVGAAVGHQAVDGGRVPAKALAHRVGVPWLDHRTAAQLAAQQRLRAPGQQRIQGPRDVHAGTDTLSTPPAQPLSLRAAQTMQGASSGAATTQRPPGAQKALRPALT